MKISALFRTPMLGVLATLALSGATLSINPTQAQAQTVQIGVVDEDKLADGYKKYADAVASIDKRAQDLDKKIPAFEFLDANESKKFETAIKASVAPNAPASAELDALVAKGLDRRATYTVLVGKAVRSTQETADMGVLTGYSTSNRVALSQLSEQLLQIVRQQQDDTDKTYTENANNVVAQIAAEKKLLMIVRKKALIYSADSVDVTGDVLNRLNK